MNWDGEMNRSEKCWLVRSSTRILGPHSIDELAQMLLKKHISIIDEVRSPQNRWRYVREYRIFDEIVRQLREEQENSPDLTQTQTLTATAQTSVTLTKTDSVANDDLTPPPPARSDVVDPFSLPLRDVVMARESTIISAPGHRPAGTSFGDMADEKVNRQLRRSQNVFRGILLGIAAVILLGIGFAQFRKNLRKESGYETLIAEARRYRTLQLYEKALASYKKATLIREPDAETQAEMALILIVLDRQNVLGRRILEQSTAGEHSNRASLIDADLGIAISYMMEGSLREATDNLQKILSMDPSNFFAHMNLAIIAFRKGEWRESEKQFEDVSKKTPHPLALVGRALSHLESGGFKDEMRSRLLAHEMRTQVPRPTLLKQEMLLMEVALLPVSDPVFATSVEQFLSEPTRQSSQFIRDLRLDWRIADWEGLDRHCRDLAARLPNLPRIKAVRAVCLAEAGRDGESRRLLDEALAQSPKDPAILFTQANLLYINGLRNEATAVLRVPEVMELPARDYLMGRICLDQGDLNCAERSFQSALEKSPTDVKVLAGIATVLSRQDRLQEASTVIRQGLEIEPAYLPLIELRDAREARR